MVLNKSSPFYLRFSLILFMLLLVGFIIYIGQDIIVPLAFAILLAVLLLPANKWLERKGMSRVIAIILSLTVSIFFAGAIIYFLSSQIAGFLQDIPAIKKHIADHAKTFQEWVTAHFKMSKVEQATLMNNAAEKVKDSGSGL